MRFTTWSLTLAVVAIGLTTVQLHAFYPVKMWDLPTYSSSVDQAVSAGNLRKVALTTGDPEVLLGLAFLARPGDAVRHEISEKAVAAQSAYAPIAAVLAVAMDGINPDSAAELIKRDPDNALGHYLNGMLLCDGGRTNDALVAFKTGAACRELRLYSSKLGDALLKTLDTLGLEGRDRLAALSWMATRRSNFSSSGLQFLDSALSELALSGESDNRKEVSEVLVGMAGHFAASDLSPMFTHRALLSAFRLKAELESQSHPASMHAYAAVAQALASVMFGGETIIQDKAGIDRTKLAAARNAATFLPGRIHFAIGITADANRYRNTGRFNQVPVRYIDNTIEAAQRLVELALTDPDGTVSPYLRGPSTEATADRSPWLSVSSVERQVSRKPELFRAALAFEEATSTLDQVSCHDNWPGYRKRLALYWTFVALASCCGALLLYRVGRRFWCRAAPGRVVG
jgi:hypothetical protein